MVTLNLSKLWNLSATLILAGTCCISLNLNASHDKESELNWYQIGFQDGNEGQNSAIFRDYESVLLSSSSDAERESYMKGWRKGLEKYCNPKGRDSKKDLLCEHYL